MRFLLLGLLLLLASTLPAYSHDPPAQKAERREIRIPVRDFSLTDQNGRRFRFEQLKGKVVLLAFAYTTCPDVCPLITAALRQVQMSLEPREKNLVYLLTVTTDPEIDSPEVLSSYANRYGVDHSNWTFLTGAAENLSAVWENFGVKVIRKGRGLVDHTPLTVLIGQDGVSRVVYVGTSPNSKVMLEDIRRLLRERL
jgi:protein SCO1/2